jgi:SET domain-containing protein
MTNPAEPANNRRRQVMRIVSSGTPERLTSDSRSQTLQDRVYVKSSPIQGLGVFARRNFATGETILVREERPVTPERPLRPERHEFEQHCDWLEDGRQVYLGFPERHINHSCEANAFVRFVNGAGTVVAMRPIRVNEEITNHYSINLSGGEPWRCGCGAESCLGIIPSSFFELPTDRQIELSPFLAPWFVAQHRAEYRTFLELTGIPDPLA